MVVTSVDYKAFLSFSSFSRLSTILASVLQFVINFTQAKENHLCFQLSPGEVKNAVLRVAFVLRNLEYLKSRH